MLDHLTCETCGIEISEDDHDSYWGQCGLCFFDDAEEWDKYRFGYDPMDDWLGD